MGTRRNLGGRYVEVREKNTSKSKKGTIMKNWSSKVKNTDEEGVNPDIIFGLVVLLIISIILLIIVL